VDEDQPPTAYSAAISPGLAALAFPPGPMELESQTLRPEGGVWTLHEDSNASVRCCAIRHRDGIPTFGFVVEEKSRPGKLDPDVIKRIPKNLLSNVGCLKDGKDLLLPDGTYVRAKDAVGPPIRGRKLAVLGDTCDPSAMLELAKGSDVLIHEATNAKLEADEETLEKVRWTFL
jgi:ribonuclease Z